MGGLGAISGPPSPATLIEARHGFCRGAPSDGGFGGHLGAPITCDVDRDAPRLLPGRAERWRVGGHLGAPITCDVDRGAPRLLPGRAERWGGCGPFRGPQPLRLG